MVPCRGSDELARVLATFLLELPLLLFSYLIHRENGERTLDSWQAAWALSLATRGIWKRQGMWPLE